MVQSQQRHPEYSSAKHCATKCATLVATCRGKVSHWMTHHLQGGDGCVASRQSLEAEHKRATLIHGHREVTPDRCKPLLACRCSVGI